jgi:hypothetical protein
MVPKITQQQFSTAQLSPAPVQNSLMLDLQSRARRIERSHFRIAGRRNEKRTQSELRIANSHQPAAVTRSSHGMRLSGERGETSLIIIRTKIACGQTRGTDRDLLVEETVGEIATAAGLGRIAAQKACDVQQQ